MIQPKQENRSFLDKFKGKANRIDKEGINKALDAQHPLDLFPKTPKKRSRGIDPSLNNSQQLRKSDFEELFANPELKPHPSIRKRITNLKPLKVDSLQPTENKGKNIEESRPISHAEPKLKFGKYLKLDEEALKHLEFLRQIEKKPVFEKRNLETLFSQR